MTDRVFVDTNILVYAYDTAAGNKHSRARQALEELWNKGNGVLSTQVLQEFSVNVRRKARHPLSTAAVAGVIQKYLSWQIITVTPQSTLEALVIEAQHRISFWDALIIHAAEASGATILYSEDFSPGQAYGPVRTVNPLTD